jgi:hypothetical protein
MGTSVSPWDEEDTFSLVDNKPAPRQRFGARRFNQQRFQRRDNGPAAGAYTRSLLSST